MKSKYTPPQHTDTNTQNEIENNIKLTKQQQKEALVEKKHTQKNKATTTATTIHHYELTSTTIRLTFVRRADCNVSKNENNPLISFRW